MARPTKEQQLILDQRIRKARGKSLTKKEFEHLLNKAAQPIQKPTEEPGKCPSSS